MHVCWERKKTRSGVSAGPSVGVRKVVDKGYHDMVGDEGKMEGV